MKKIGKMTYDNFVIYGEVSERLPLYTDNLDTVYALSGDSKTIFPDCEIRKASTVHGNSSMITNKSNVSIIDDCMNFNGNSEIQLDKELLNTDGFEFKIKFKLTDMTNTLMSLLICKSKNGSTYENELSVIIDNIHRYIYADIKGKMYSEADLDKNRKYSMTDSGAINKDLWYTLKIEKQGHIVAVYLNEVLTRTLIYKDDFNCDYISIGQGFKGLIEYIQITKYNKKFEEDRYSITNDNLLNSFTACFYWTPDPVGVYDIANIGQFNITSSANSMSVSLDNVKLASLPVIEENTYYISLAYNKEEQQAHIYVYNQTRHELLFKTNKAININTNTIDIINDSSVYDLAIYKTFLEERFILRNISKKFSMNKHGDIKYNIDEDNIGFRFGNSYHLPMSCDLNSICKTIASDEEVYISDQSVKSGIYEADEVIKLIETDIITPVTENWNNDLHHKAYEIPKWNNGYNGGVSNPEIGYHAKWTTEYSSPETMQLKFINCNSDFGLINRMLRSYRIISTDELWNKCKVGDKISILFKARADMSCNIQVGIYRSQNSTGSYGFGENLKTINIQNSYWTEYCYETTIDEDWNLSKEARLYFYGHLTDKATSCIKEVYLVRNGNKAPINVITDKINREISIPFKDQIGLNAPNLSVLYSTKLFSKNNNIVNTMKDISWGIEDNELYLRVGNKESRTSIKEVQINEWITIGVTITSSNAIIYLGTRQGIYSCSLNNLSLTANNIGDLLYDNNNCCLYKDLFISEQVISQEKFEAYHRTKISYFNNLIILKNNIEESNM